MLTQAERDVVYAVRDYSHYQKTFAIETVGEYFRVLQDKDAVRNSYNNYLNLQKARDRAEAVAEAERLARYQVDQARQSELSARVKYLKAVESYGKRWIASSNGLACHWARRYGWRTALMTWWRKD